MTTVEDLLYKDNLAGKKYMMGVSPWFYTGTSPALPHEAAPLRILTAQCPDLAQWNKHWYCSSESLWYDRWQQVLEIMPDFVQIITCTPAPASNPGTVSSKSSADAQKGTTLANQATSATTRQHKSSLGRKSMLLGTRTQRSGQFCRI